MGKYLPIGTICAIKNTNKKIMIIGYYGVEFDGNIKIKDYIGCSYPEGLLKFEQMLSFNHNDIESILFKGYLSKDYEIFNKNISGLSEKELGKDNKKISSNKVYSKIEFDENGVVVFAEPLTKEKINEKQSNDKYEFDENGTVISISRNTGVDNPFHKEINRKFAEKEVNYKEIITDKKTSISPKFMETLNKIEYDSEKGLQEISNNSIISKHNMGDNYEFDENGVVVKQKKSNNISNYK